MVPANALLEMIKTLPEFGTTTVTVWHRRGGRALS
jgi:hypothetical protein